MKKINKMFFDLINQDTLVFIDDVEKKQKIIDYHLIERNLIRDYPNYNIPNITRYSGKLEWIELGERLTRLTFSRVILKILFLPR